MTPSKEFETGSSASAALTIVAVNGARQTLDEGATFPSSDPVFVLVSEQPDAKSVVIGVVGGEYAGGMKTTTLKVGKPLTLVNTTTGAAVPSQARLGRKWSLDQDASGSVVDSSRRR